jgi:hypothetical protein
MIDWYSKIVLTVIAVALVVIAVQRAGLEARAALDDCGVPQRPCYVAFAATPEVQVTNSLRPLEVRVAR